MYVLSGRDTDQRDIDQGHPGQLVHPVIVDRDVWQDAQNIAAEHGTSRDGDEPNIHPATRRTYVYRSRVRCRDCERRMAGRTTAGRHADFTYYKCPHDAANPKHAADTPDHLAPS